MVWLTPKIKCNFCTSFVFFLYTQKRGFFLFLVPIRTFPIAPSHGPKVPGEATVRNISEKCRHKLALSLVIIVSSVKFYLRILLERKFLAKPGAQHFKKLRLYLHICAELCHGKGWVAILRRRRTVRYFFRWPCCMLPSSFSLLIGFYELRP